MIRYGQLLPKRRILLSPNRLLLSNISTRHQHATPHKETVEAEKRDHRVVGKSQDLFMIHHWSPGSVFMLPHGTRIVRKLQEYIRKQYADFGFDEVMTPLIYKKDLWEASGHWQNYRDDMFTVSYDQESKDVFGLKPMNCPGHCLIFDNQPKSYRDLPVRLADFGALHRNEHSGALSGLTRVRQFYQDDAHIFCTESQVFQEISSTLAFVERVYNAFKFPRYDFVLSTRSSGSKYIGEVSEWDRAEESLKQALDACRQSWTVRPGDAAFYGPKIDILVKDAHDRTHQTATIQLDFQLPRRFGLTYQDSDGNSQIPVIVHRAVLGSFERMMAILMEHTAGKWPFWLNPRQAIVIPIGEAAREYAETVRKQLASRNGRAPHKQDVLFIDIDKSAGKTLNKMIREAQVAQYNYILVVGEKEKESKTVNVRRRDGKNLGSMPIEEILQLFEHLELNYE